MDDKTVLPAADASPRPCEEESAPLELDLPCPTCRMPPGVGCRQSDGRQAISFCASRTRKAHAAPLRKVIEVYRKPVGSSGGFVLKERLECGHEKSVKQDIYGATNAYRRRCRQCVKDLQGAGHRDAAGRERTSMTPNGAEMRLTFDEQGRFGR